MSLNKYRAIDLTILTLIACGLEGIIIFGLQSFDVLFVVSVTTVMLLISLIRWNAWGLIVGLISGVFSAWFTVYLNGADEYMTQMLVVYGLGNLFVAVELLYFKLIKPEQLYKGNWWLILYILIGFVSVCLGRTVLALFFGNPFWYYLKQQILAEALNVVFAIIILFIANRQESFLRNQKDYFLQVRGGNDEK